MAAGTLACHYFASTGRKKAHEPAGVGTVPIRPYLSGQAFEPEMIRLMSLVFESACKAMRLSPSVDDGATRMVAQKIIELAQRGIRNQAELLRRTLEEFK
jgi:hypothetical protein